MPKKQYRVGVTVNKKLYDLLAEKSKEELRTMASVAKYYLIKGLENAGYENIEELAE